MADSELADVAMATPGARCSFCGHVNPATAKYCNECAADLNLTLCPACSAVNKRSMAQCHKCAAPLRGTSDQPVAVPASDAGDAPPAPPAPKDPRPSRAPALALVAIACVAAAAYAAYRAGIVPPTFTANMPAQETVARGSDASRVEPSRVEPSRVEPSRIEPSRVEPSRGEPSSGEPSSAGAAPLAAPAREDVTIPQPVTEHAPVGAVPREEPLPDQRIEPSPMQATSAPKDTPAPERPASEPSRSGCTDAVAALALCDSVRPSGGK